VSGFARSGLSRSDVVVAVGGGVVTTWPVRRSLVPPWHGLRQRGHHVLAQVDAAVGGKTGVNLPEGKNLVGAFWQPPGGL